MLTNVVGGCYKLVQKIGEGGMGEVYRGVDINLEREVAVKVIRPELAGRVEILRRFRKEAVVLARLNHPNIATLYNFIRDQDRYLMVMEFAPGRTLDVIIAEHVHGLPSNFALRIFLDALRAIEHAHKQGIIHRDIKPANLMVGDGGAVKVLDFGIARILGESGFTRAGVLLGTTKYMSPEQILGRPIDTRSDIYSLATVLYRMLSGRLPFEGLSEYEFMKAQIELRPRPVTEIVPELPQAVAATIAQALEKDPGDRFQHISEFIAKIAPVLREDASGPEVEQVRDHRMAARARMHAVGLTEGSLARQDADTPTTGGLSGVQDARARSVSSPAPQLVYPSGARVLAEVPIGVPRLGPAPAAPPRSTAEASRARPPPADPTLLDQALLGPRAYREAEIGAPASMAKVERLPDSAAVQGNRSRRHDGGWTWKGAAGGVVAAVTAIALLAGQWLISRQGAAPVMQRADRASGAAPVPKAREPAETVAGGGQGQGDAERTQARPEVPEPKASDPPRPPDPERVAPAIPGPPPVAAPMRTAESPASDIDALLAGAEGHLGADRLVSPPGANALEDYEAVLLALPDHAGAQHGKERILRRLMELANQSAQRGSWEQAEDYLDQGMRVAPASEELRRERQALRDRRSAAETKRIASEARRAEQRKLYRRLVTLSREAITAGDWPRAEAYLREASALPVGSESELAPLREAVAAHAAGRERVGRSVTVPESEIAAPFDQARDIASTGRSASAQPPEVVAMPAPPDQGSQPTVEPALDAVTATRPPEPAAPGTVVEILEAAAVPARARPGETVEFYTRLRVVPPRGRSDAYVVAAWLLKRNGRGLGEPGAKGAFAKPGVSTMSTRLTLPPGMGTGRYMVEHRVQSETAEATARSYFSVVSR